MTKSLSPHIRQHGTSFEEFTRVSCAYFDGSKCSSCSHLGIEGAPYVTRKSAEVHQQLVGAHISDEIVLPLHTVQSPWGSRNKTKVSVLGTPTSPFLGIVGEGLKEQELERCPLPPLEVHSLLQTIKKTIIDYKLIPYDIQSRRGELKGIIVTINSLKSEGLVRFVLRSTESVPRIRKAIPHLREQHPWLTVMSANIQPLPAAIVEGPEELLLSEQQFITESYNDLRLSFAPQSFMQVTHEIAQKLYGTFERWIMELEPQSVLDLFCGAGGFAFHAARHCEQVHGVEISSAAIESARNTCSRLGLTKVSFQAMDADAAVGHIADLPEVLVANPPRRGLSDAIRGAIRAHPPRHIFYSSCNPETFVRDIQALSDHYTVTRVAPFDMFPLTRHVEVLGHLERR